MKQMSRIKKKSLNPKEKLLSPEHSAFEGFQPTQWLKPVFVSQLN